MEQLSKEEEEELTDMLLKELTKTVEADDLKAFMDLCITKREKCDEGHFTGKSAIFNWKVTANEKDRERFWRTYQCVFTEDPAECPVDGAWSEWSLWSKCDATCEEPGSQTRTRLCENPKPSGGGDECNGLSVRNQSCTGLCVQDSNGREEAEQYLQQTHDVYHELQKMCVEHHCLFSQVQGHIKNHRRADKYWSSLMCVKFGGACPVNGGWGQWGQWSDCSVHCGYGESVRKRQCSNPVTQHGGLICQGDWHELKRCLAKACGKGVTFSDWSMFTPCSERCGKYGTKTTVRSCLSATPCMLEGRGVSEVVKTVPCYGGNCPADGGWSKWGTWTECSSKCGPGRRTRLRWCDSPYPYGGKNCIGPAIDAAGCAGGYCIQPAAPEDDEDDDETERRRRRRRRSISVWESGKSVWTRTLGPLWNSLLSWLGVHLDHASATTIEGLSGNSSDAILRQEPPNGSYDVPKTPLYRFEHEPLRGSASRVPALEKMDCVERNEEPSNTTSNYTFQGRGRDDDIEMDSVGHNETVLVFKKENDFDQPKTRRRRSSPASEVDASDPYSAALNLDLEALYTPWSQWSQCSSSCGVGTRQRARHCRDELKVCRGEIQPIQFCNVKPCPVAGSWSAWESWTPCSVTCGTGEMERYRKCDNPLPSYGGSCVGLSSKSQSCVQPGCPPTKAKAWTSWGEWSECSTSCGFGAKSRSRFRQLMSDTESEESVCNGFPCPENGLWAAWGAWESCTRPCGLGQMYRDRTCTDPSPLYHGKPCDGQGSDIQGCFGGPCADDDDVGILLRGNGYLQYNPKGKSTEMLMVFLRFKTLRPAGVLFHHTRSCEAKKPCRIDIKLQLRANVPVLTATVVKRDKLKITTDSPINHNDWNDVLVVVTSKYVELKLNDQTASKEPFTGDLDTSANLDGDLVVGGSNVGSSVVSGGFHGEVAVLRKNFKTYSLLPTKAWSGEGAPSTSRNVGKVTLPTEVRHPNFQGAFFSHMFFRKSKILHVSTVMQVTGSDGLLFFNGGEIASSFVSVAVERNGIKFCLSCGVKPQCRKAYEIEVGKWFLLNFVVENKEAVIRLNNGDAMQIMCSDGVPYVPRSSLYVAGAKGTDWDTIVDATRKDIRFRGLIDTLDVNGLLISFKMATLLSANGVLNILGYSLADHVTEIYGHHKSLTTLRCAFPRTEKAAHFVKLMWTRNMQVLQSDKETEIVNTESKDKSVSVVNVFPNEKTDGVYACVENADGELNVRHVFLVLLYKDNSKDPEAESEWIVFVILMVLLVLALAAIGAYFYWHSRRNKAEKKEDEVPIAVEDEGETTDTGVTSDSDAEPLQEVRALQEVRVYKPVEVDEDRDQFYVSKEDNLQLQKPKAPHRQKVEKAIDDVRQKRVESFKEEVRQSLSHLDEKLDKKKKPTKPLGSYKGYCRPYKGHCRPCRPMSAYQHQQRCVSPDYRSQTTFQSSMQSISPCQPFNMYQQQQLPCGLPYQRLTPVNTGKTCPMAPSRVVESFVPVMQPQPQPQPCHQQQRRTISPFQLQPVDMMRFSPAFVHEQERHMVNPGDPPMLGFIQPINAANNSNSLHMPHEQMIPAAVNRSITFNTAGSTQSNYNYINLMPTGQGLKMSGPSINHHQNLAHMSPIRPINAGNNFGNYGVQAAFNFDVTPPETMMSNINLELLKGGLAARGLRPSMHSISRPPGHIVRSHSSVSEFDSACFDCDGDTLEMVDTQPLLTRRVGISSRQYDTTNTDGEYMTTPSSRSKLNSTNRTRNKMVTFHAHASHSDGGRSQIQSESEAIS